nr:retrovirus-related Pol polyprotein from transposon TNT 1-94 [Tanacetum cinerariifolium]
SIDYVASKDDIADPFTKGLSREAQSTMYNEKSRHIRRRHNSIRQLLSAGVISIDYAASNDNIADPFTKGLSRDNDKMIKSTKDMLKSKFDMKDMGLADVILGIKITRTQNGLVLSQAHYVDKILNTHNAGDSGLARTPVDNSLHLSKNKGVDLPPGCKPLGYKWIFKKKIKADGTIDKYKARLVIKGFRQREGLDYFDTYSPVSRITSIRMILAISALRNLEVHQMDVKTAFLNEDL